MSLLNNLKIWQKLSLIVVALCVPIALLSQLLMAHIDDDIDATNHEIQGMQYLQPVRLLLQHFAEHRGMSQAYLNGDAAFRSKIMDKQAQIAKDIQTLQAVHAQYGVAFQSVGQWEEIQADWGRLKVAAFDLTPPESFQRHTALLKKLVELNTFVSVTSGLILDPTVDCYFLVDTVINRLITFLEDMGQLRALSSGVTARFRITGDEQLRLAKLVARSQIMRESIQSGLDRSLSYNKPLEILLKPKHEEVLKRTGIFLKLVEQDVITGFFNEQTLTPAEVFGTATAAIDSGFALYDTAAPALVDLLHKRVAALTYTKHTTLGSIVAGVCLALAFAYSFIRIIVQSLHRAEHMAAEIAQGKLHNTNTMLPVGKDELGQLLRSLAATQSELIRVLTGIKHASETVGAGAQEISQGTEDLAHRTERQAAALEETAASIEELTATVRQSADNAARVNQLAAATKIQAQKGGKTVEKAIIAMGEIHQSSYQIAKTITLIDEIAFRTNLLALNAAVEAAVAGDKGRGFAVVASEVRELAQRSAAAAKEIKMTIEDSVEKVESGGVFIADAGKTLREIVSAVTSVSEMVADITVASREQTVGIEQVNTAITQMDQTTQQNAALVEEASAACQSLRDQAVDLQELLAFFKLDGTTSRH